MPKPDLPSQALLRQGQEGFDDPGIAEEPGQAAGVAGGVEEIGIVRPGVPAEGKPALKERRRGATTKSGKPAATTRTEKSQRAGASPPEPGGSKVRRERDRQDQERQAEEQEMNRELSAETSPRRAEVGVGVTGQEGGLVEHQARVPDPRAFHPERAGPSCRSWAGPRRARRPPGTSSEPNNQAKAGVLACENRNPGRPSSTSDEAWGSSISTDLLQ